MPLLVEGRRVRLPQSAGDLVRAHPLLEVSRARVGGFEADPRETCQASPSPRHPTATIRCPPRQTLNLAQLRCWRHIGSPGRQQPTFCLRWRHLWSLYLLWTLEGICRGPFLAEEGLGPREVRLLAQCGTAPRLEDTPGLSVSRQGGPRPPLRPRRHPDLARFAKSGQPPVLSSTRRGPHPVWALHRRWVLRKQEVLPGWAWDSVWARVSWRATYSSSPAPPPPSGGHRAPVIFSQKKGPGFSPAGPSWGPRPDSRVLFCFLLLSSNRSLNPLVHASAETVWKAILIVKKKKKRWGTKPPTCPRSS